MKAAFIQPKCFLLIFLFLALSYTPAAGSSSRDLAVEAAFQHGEEVILDGQVDYTPQGVVMFTSVEKQMVFLDNVVASGNPGRHIMVVGYLYKKGGNYHINVTGYTFLEQ